MYLPFSRDPSRAAAIMGHAGACELQCDDWSPAHLHCQPIYLSSFQEEIYFVTKLPFYILTEIDTYLISLRQLAKHISYCKVTLFNNISHRVTLIVALFR